MYCTQDDIINRRIPEDDLIQLTDDDNLGVVDTAVVASIIAEQDELIDGYLRQQYDLPLSSVPGFLTGIAVDLCCHALYMRRPQFDIPAAVEKAYSVARKQLLDIKRRELVLDVEVANTSASTAGASFEASPRLTGRDKMTGLL